MMNLQPPDSLVAAIAALRARHPISPYVERRFEIADDWKNSIEYSLRNWSISRRHETTLGSILCDAHATIVGEPGAGKSTVSRAAVLLCLDRWEQGQVPFRLELRHYRGSIRSLIEAPDQDASRALEFEAKAHLGEDSTSRLYILDGLDEVPGELLQSFVGEIPHLLNGGFEASVLLTCRQAFYAHHRELFANDPKPYVLLDLAERDIRSLIAQAGLGPHELLSEVERVRLRTEIANPFVLKVIIDEYAAKRSLSPLRSSSLDTVVSKTLDTVHGVDPFRHRRALRMLAVAMECYARNELTIDESLGVLTNAMPIEQAAARALVEELMASILIQTSSGISFQMRSFGEYLAAEELRHSDLNKILGLVCVPGTRVPNESWQNSLTYLVEMHVGVRRYFSLHHPEWVVSSSPAAFTETEREVVVRSVLGGLEAADEYLFHHDLVNVDRLAGFVTPTTADELRRVYQEHSAKGVNAVLLLAATGDRRVKDRAIALAVDRTLRQLHRLSGMQACAKVAGPHDLATLASAVVETDSLYLSLLDTIGSLVDEEHLPHLLPLVLKADALISGAFYRCQELRSLRAAVVTLDMLLAQPALAQHSRIGSYVDPILENLPDVWDDAISEKIARLYVAWECARVWEQQNRIIDAITASVERGDPQGTVARRVFELLMSAAQPLQYIEQSVARVTPVSVAEWLVKQPNGLEYAQELAFSARPDVREALRPWVAMPSRAEVEARERASEERERVERETRAREAEVMTTATDFRGFLRGTRVAANHWPQLGLERRQWVADQVSQCLETLRLPQSIAWTSENSFSMPEVLPILFKVIDHYQLSVTNDTRVVQSLLGVEADPIASYYNRIGFTDAAKAEFDSLLGSAAASPGPLYHLFGFLHRTTYWSDATAAALVALATNPGVAVHHRTAAVELYGRRASDPIGPLIPLLKDSNDVVARYARNVLVELQHKPTIERSFNELLASERNLRAANVEFPAEGPAAWLKLVKTKAVWPRLVELREETLKLALPELASSVTGVMKRIDLGALVEVMRQQLAIAPAEWKDAQTLHLHEYEREDRLAQARHAPFDHVLRRLIVATTMKMFKLWCEGPNDIGVWEQWLEKWPTAADAIVTIDSVNGWDQLQNVNYRFARLWDGCNDTLVVMDGDKGRDLSAPDRPLTPLAQRISGRLMKHGVELRVLKRYAPENYFSQTACEAVLRGPLASYFPLPEGTPIKSYLPGYDKTMNPQIASAMQPQDLAGTDVGEILDDVAKRSRM